MQRFSQATEDDLKTLLFATPILILLFPEISIAQEAEAPLKVLPPEMADEIYNKLARAIDEQMHQHRTMFEWGIWIFGILLSVSLGGAIWAGYGRIDEIKRELRERVELSTNEGVLQPIISKSIKTELDERVMREINETMERMKALEKKLQRAERFFNFKLLVRDIDKSVTYTKEQLNETMGYVREFKDDILSESREEALSVLRTLTNKLYRSNRISELKTIEEMFPDLVKSDLTIRNRMIESYTLRVFEPFSTEEDIARLREHLRAAWEAGYGETALAEEIVLAYKLSPDPSPARHADIAKLYRMADSFTSRELQNFLNSLSVNADTELLSGNPQPRHFAIAEVGLLAIEENRDTVVKLLEKLLRELPESIKEKPIAALDKLLNEH